MANRIELADEVLENVAGGNLQCSRNGEGGGKIWVLNKSTGVAGPKYRYTQENIVFAFINDNYDTLGDQGCVNALVAQGLLVLA